MQACIFAPTGHLCSARRRVRRTGYPRPLLRGYTGFVVSRRRVKAPNLSAAHFFIAETWTVAVAVFETEIDRPANRQAQQVRIRRQCRRQKLGQDVQGREGYWVAPCQHDPRIGPVPQQRSQ